MPIRSLHFNWNFNQVSIRASKAIMTDYISVRRMKNPERKTSY